MAFTNRLTAYDFRASLLQLGDYSATDLVITPTIRSVGWSSCRNLERRPAVADTINGATRSFDQSSG